MEEINKIDGSANSNQGGELSVKGCIIIIIVNHSTCMTNVVHMTMRVPFQ